MVNLLDLLSWILNLVLLIWAVYERILSQRDKDYIRASIRVWQHQAQGLSAAIKSLAAASGGTVFHIGTKFTNTSDVGIALSSIHDVAESMSQSLYESRFFSDEELKENMKRDKEKEEKLEKKIISPKTRKQNRKRIKHQ